MKKRLYIILGAVDAISAYWCSRIGVDYIWASSFVMSAMLGLQDKGMVNIKNFLPMINSLIKGSTCPVILDFDIGGRNPFEYRSQLKHLKNLSLGGICIEDEKWPKYNAMLKSPTKNLIPPKMVALKISIAKKILNPKTLIIARTHSLIRNEPIIKLQRRIHTYQNAGADVICIDYTNKDWKFYEKVIDSLNISKPLMVIFSKQDFLPKSILSNAKIKFILFPNQIYRVMLYPILQLGKNRCFRVKSLNFGKKLIGVKYIFKILNEINGRRK